MTMPGSSQSSGPAGDGLHLYSNRRNTTVTKGGHTVSEYQKMTATDARTWLIVVQRADYRCQCTGACGDGHAADHGRCGDETSHRLVVAPADPGATGVSACRVHIDQLQAWCRLCLAAAIRNPHRDQGGEVPGQMSLLEVGLDEVVGVPA